MNKRLQTILDIEHITASQLADTLGIQRGGVSHLLSGRNKPSFDFLEKILRKYPEINAEWLITGTGKPIRNTSADNNAQSSSHNRDKYTYISDIQSNIRENDLFGESYPKDDTPERQVADHAAPPPSQTVTAPQAPAAVSKEKKPTRVIIYFSDGTYSEFYPFSVPSQG